MSDTRINPEEFLEMSPSKYFRLLEKDLARLSKKTGYKEYVVIQKFQFETKKQSIFLFASPDDKDWEEVIEKAKERGKRFATGDCKVVEVMDRDGNGDPDITIGIKTASGDMTKFKVAEVISEEVFEDDDDVEAVLIGEMQDQLEEDEDTRNAIRQKRKSANSERKEGAKLTSEKFLNELSKLKNQSKIQSFINQFKKVFASRSPESILINYNQIIKSSTSKDLQKLDNEIENELDQIYRTIDLGKSWYNSSSDEDELNIKELVAGQLIKIKQLARRLERIEEGIESKIKEKSI